MLRTPVTKKILIKCEDYSEFAFLMFYFEKEKGWNWHDKSTPTERLRTWRWQTSNSMKWLHIEFKDNFNTDHFPKYKAIVIPFWYFRKIYNLDQWRSTYDLKETQFIEENAEEQK